jgi:hypothetical protein
MFEILALILGWKILRKMPDKIYTIKDTKPSWKWFMGWE